ncbi:MAG: helix-turn-helix domain-containing protein [Myxococcota bacterium]
MGELLHETTPPLAWDHEGMPFTPPPTAVAWKVRHYTGRRGRPKMVFTEHGPAHLDLDATMEDLRTLVKDAPGVYWLYMVDAEGNELEPIACIEMLPKDSAQNLAVVGEDSPAAAGDAPVAAAAPAVAAASASVQRPGPGAGPWPGHDEERRFMMEMCRQMLTSRDAHDERMTALVSRLVQSTVSIQEQVAGSLTALNESVRVANGLDAVARLPPAPDVNAEEIAEMVADALDDGDDKDDKSKKKSWIDTIFSGPLGMMIVNTIQGVTSGMQQGQRIQAEAMAMEAEAKQAEAEAARMAAEAEMIKAATAAGLKVKVVNEYPDGDDEDDTSETGQDQWSGSDDGDGAADLGEAGEASGSDDGGGVADLGEDGEASETDDSDGAADLGEESEAAETGEPEDGADPVEARSAEAARFVAAAVAGTDDAGGSKPLQAAADEPLTAGATPDGVTTDRLAAVMTAETDGEGAASGTAAVGDSAAQTALSGAESVHSAETDYDAADSATQGGSGADTGAGEATEASDSASVPSDSPTAAVSLADEVLNADQVAAMLGVDRKTIYSYASRGEIPHRRLGKRLLFSRTVLIEWLATG